VSRSHMILAAAAAASLAAAPAAADPKHAAAPAPPAAAELAGFAWDAKASADLEAELHRLHQLWNDGDIATLKTLIVGDPSLPTFELDVRTHKPIRLVGKADIDRFIVAATNSGSSDGVRVELDTPVTACRATGGVGVCTEECTVRYRDAAGDIIATDHLRSTQIAVKTEQGWRWIQWQMANTGAATTLAAR
jgi:hypothetical protein